MSLVYAIVQEQKKLLGNLEAWLEKGVAHAKSRGGEADALLQSRLIVDQYTLLRQVQVACDNAKFSAFRLAGKEAPKHPDTETTLEEIRARIASVRGLLETFKASDFDGAETRMVTIPRREGTATFPGAQYLVEIAQPNFYFHLTTAYAILRANGVELGKADYLGPITPAK
jgi:hypothetical protein